MDDVYSVYDAKARFSEVIRKVREGRSVFVTYHGRTVAEIRPIDRPETEIGRRLQVLEGLGVIVGEAERVGSLESVEKRPGALERFLDERADEGHAESERAEEGHAEGQHAADEHTE